MRNASFHFDRTKAGCLSQNQILVHTWYPLRDSISFGWQPGTMKMGGSIQGCVYHTWVTIHASFVLIVQASRNHIQNAIPNINKEIGIWLQFWPGLYSPNSAVWPATSRSVLNLLVNGANTIHVFDRLTYPKRSELLPHARVNWAIREYTEPNEMRFVCSQRHH